jgi:hypothetical protein
VIDLCLSLHTIVDYVVVGPGMPEVLHPTQEFDVKARSPRLTFESCEGVGEGSSLISRSVQFQNRFVSFRQTRMRPRGGVNQLETVLNV